MSSPYGYFRLMFRKDQIKGIIALILFACIGLSYFLFNEEIAKWVAVAGVIAWLVSMYYLNRMR